MHCSVVACQCMPPWPGCDSDTAACAVALINSIGNVGGLVGPVTVGLLSEREGGREATEHVHALGFLGASAMLAGVLVLLFRPAAQHKEADKSGADGDSEEDDEEALLSKKHRRMRLDPSFCEVQPARALYRGGVNNGGCIYESEEVRS